MSKPIDPKVLRLLSYEISMLHTTAVLLMQSSTHFCPAGPGTSAVRNALLESFLLHYRILAEFLSKKRTSWTKSDQILGEDFLGELPVPPSSRVTHNLTQCHQQLAHLSSHRKPARKRRWNFGAMYTQIIRPLQRLIHKCAPNQPTPTARRHYDHLLSLPITIQ